MDQEARHTAQKPPRNTRKCSHKFFFLSRCLLFFLRFKTKAEFGLKTVEAAAEIDRLVLHGRVISCAISCRLDDDQVDVLRCRPTSATGRVQDAGREAPCGDEILFIYGAYKNAT